MPWEREEIRSSLKKKGFVEETDRDHDVLVLQAEGLTRAIFTKLSRGKRYKVYGDALLAEMSRQLQLTRRQLDSLIECPMELTDYVAALRERGLVRQRGHLQAPPQAS